MLHFAQVLDVPVSRRNGVFPILHKEGVTINTFMLDSNYYLMEFVNQITKLNKGRAFFTTPEKLGQYILVDYLSNKKKRIAS